MEQITYNDIPSALSQILDRLAAIEKKLSIRDTIVKQPETDKRFTVDELREYLPGKPAKQTIYTNVSNGKLPRYKDGKRLWFLKSEIDDYLAAGKKKNNEETTKEVDAYLSGIRRRRNS